MKIDTLLDLSSISIHTNLYIVKQLKDTAFSIYTSILPTMKDIQFKLLDFRVFDEEMVEDETDSDSSEHTSVKTKQFRVQVFGLDEKGRTYSLILTDFEPFFYIKVDHTWTRNTKNGFERHIKKLVGKYHADNITKIQLVERETLYGFDNGQKYKFMCIKFTNTTTMNKVKNLFYYNPKVTHSDGTETSERKLIPDGLPYRDSTLELYEANIPPLLRLFHIRKISPSGWVSVSKRSLKPSSYKRTTSNFEYTIPYSKLSPLPEKEDPVPYKICSFDIEASSSHGDFPVPIKNYKKLAGNIIDYWGQYNDVLDDESDEIKKEHIIALVESAFGYGHSDDVDLVYPKRKPKDIKDVRRLANLIVNKTLKDAYKASTSDFSEQLDNQYNIEDMFLGSGDVDNTDTTKEATGVDDERPSYMAAKERADFRRIKQRKAKMKKEAKHGILYFLDSKDHDREEKMDAVTKILDSTLPPLKGDMVTFIGSTFLKYGDADPYLNHCITLNTCTDVDGAEIERYNNEADVLLAWTKLIQRENPDIIIGYNIFGFDYSFMFYRAKENGPECVKEFLKLSRNKDEVCWNKSYKTNEYDIERSSITIASGTHNLHFVKMAGRIQVDLYNYFRREYNLSSYKLDYASGHFIGDKVKTLEQNPASNITVVKSKNLTGLKKGAYVNFEEIGHSTEYYEDGKKFNVTDVDLNTGEFVVEGVVTPDMKKTIRWCLAKDDVTPQDIFRFTNQGPNERAIVAKYCIQDCNLVHHLLRKIDVVTGIVEMAKICSVPIDFIIMRGQGIKLFSFIAKKCREAGVLIPVLERKNDGSYEGAIVLPPKTGLYLNEPVACVDYSSLYPSSMISENLSHDSKVWTREYNLKGELIEENGVKNENGEFVYDNLEGFKYVDVTYDTYKYLRLNPRGAEVKTKVGYKTCRFAQFPDGNLAIMPRILKELLAARKATRTSAKWKTVKTSIGDYTGLVIEKTDDHITLKEKDGNVKVIETESIISIGDTYDDFMKNVLDKRQLAIKVTANSLYGQCGARTSSFYEKDVAASTTATGRKLLTYGKRIVEDVYGDRICETKYGKVHSHAEYVYGDTDSIFMSFKLTRPNSTEKIVGKEALKHTIELAKEAGELATKFLKGPHDLEYEKTFMPFCLLSKKRYVGMLYEEDPEKCYRKSMGIVLKRRDNAPIVKDVYGGIIDILMKDQDIGKAVSFTKDCLQNIVDEKYPLEKLVITKSLRSFYKNPQQIAHKVLADRMGKRDPGNKPSSGDRIPFVYIQTKGKQVLQGDKIEHPEYIKKNNIRPDYTFYITNQIMKPVQQLFGLVLEDIPGFEKKRRTFLRKERCKLRAVEEKGGDALKIRTEREKLRNKEIKELIFDDALRKGVNDKNGQHAITSFFGFS